MEGRLEEWELEMLLEGEGTPEMEAALAASPADQARLAALMDQTRALQAALFRVTCPAPLELGEYELGLLEAPRRVAVAAHLDECPHCAEELEGLTAALQAAVRPPATTGGLRRIVMRLAGALDGLGSLTPAPALRGADQVDCYIGEDFMLSLARREVAEGIELTGTLLASEGEGRATLRQVEEVVYEAPLSSAATFSFQTVPPGHYDLVVVTPQAELIVSDLLVE